MLKIKYIPWLTRLTWKGLEHARISVITSPLEVVVMTRSSKVHFKINLMHRLHYRNGFVRVLTVTYFIVKVRRKFRVPLSPLDVLRVKRLEWARRGLSMVYKSGDGSRWRSDDGWRSGRTPRGSPHDSDSPRVCKFTTLFHFKLSLRTSLFYHLRRTIVSWNRTMLWGLFVN